MAGFNLPIQAIPPQLLAEMARAAFKPPALMSGGGGGGMGGGGMQMPQSQGFNVGQGMAGMGQGLGMLAGQLNKEPDLNERTRRSDAEIADWSKYGTPEQPQPGWFARTFGGGLADGGPVMPGKYYTVGEQGPETFVPAVPGTIVPNDPYSALRPSEMPLYDPSSVLRPSEMPLYDPSSVLRPSERDFFGGRGRR